MQWSYHDLRVSLPWISWKIFAGFNVSNQILSVYVNNTINVDLLTDNNKMTEAEFFGKYGNPRNIPINRERMIRRFLMNHKKLDLYIPRKTEYYHMYFEGSDYVNGLATDVIRYIILTKVFKHVLERLCPFITVSFTSKSTEYDFMRKTAFVNPNDTA